VEHYSDGTIVGHHMDGTIVEHYSDGAIVEHYMDGTIVEQYSDGAAQHLPWRMRFLDHTQQRSTIGKTPLDE
jgi:hypothetical protein